MTFALENQPYKKTKDLLVSLESFNIFYIKLYEITSRKMYIGHQKFPFFTVNEITKDEIFQMPLSRFQMLLLFLKEGK